MSPSGLASKKKGSTVAPKTTVAPPPRVTTPLSVSARPRPRPSPPRFPSPCPDLARSGEGEVEGRPRRRSGSERKVVTPLLPLPVALPHRIWITPEREGWLWLRAGRSGGGEATEAGGKRGEVASRRGGGREVNGGREKGGHRGVKGLLGFGAAGGGFRKIPRGGLRKNYIIIEFFLLRVDIKLS